MSDEVQETEQKWLIEVSDVVSGALIIKGQRFTSGRYVTSDPYIAERIGLEDPRYFSVTKIDEDQDVEVGPVETEGQDTEGTLTSADVRHPESRTSAKKACDECGVEYKSLNQHGRLSGHDVNGSEKSKVAGESDEAKGEEKED